MHIGTCFEAIGRPFEWDVAVCEVVATEAKQPDEPEDKIQQVKKDDQQCQLLPYMHHLMSHVAIGEPRRVVEDEGEQSDGTVVPWRKVVGMYQNGVHAHVAGSSFDSVATVAFAFATAAV